MTVVDKIKEVPTGNNGPHGDVPTETVAISGVSVSDDYADK